MFVPFLAVTTQEDSLLPRETSHLFQGPPLVRMTGLHEAYRDAVFAYVSRRLKPCDAAEDVVAQTFEAAFVGLARLRRMDDPYVWLLGIARRKLAAAYRSRDRRGETPIARDLPDPQNIEGIVLAREQVFLIHRAIAELPHDQREAILLQHLEGLSHQQIAGVLGKSPHAVNSLLQRARLSLGQKLAPFFPELEDSHA